MYPIRYTAEQYILNRFGLDAIHEDVIGVKMISFFGVGRSIINQQNIYRVTHVHYLHKAAKKT